MKAKEVMDYDMFRHVHEQLQDSFGDGNESELTKGFMAGIRVASDAFKYYAENVEYKLRLERLMYKATTMSYFWYLTPLEKEFCNFEEYKRRKEKCDIRSERWILLAVACENKLEELK